MWARFCLMPALLYTWLEGWCPDPVRVILDIPISRPGLVSGVAVFFLHHLELSPSAAARGHGRGILPPAARLSIRDQLQPGPEGACRGGSGGNLCLLSGRVGAIRKAWGSLQRKRLTYEILGFLGPMSHPLAIQTSPLKLRKGILAAA